MVGLLGEQNTIVLIVEYSKVSNLDLVARSAVWLISANHTRAFHKLNLLIRRREPTRFRTKQTLDRLVYINQIPNLLSKNRKKIRRIFDDFVCFYFANIFSSYHHLRHILISA